MTSRLRTPLEQLRLLLGNIVLSADKYDQPASAEVTVSGEHYAAARKYLWPKRESPAYKRPEYASPDDPAYMDWPALHALLWERLRNDDEREDDALMFTRAEMGAVLSWAHNFDRAAQPRRDEEQRTYDIIRRAAELIKTAPVEQWHDKHGQVLRVGCTVLLSGGEECVVIGGDAETLALRTPEDEGSFTDVDKAFRVKPQEVELA